MIVRTNKLMEKYLGLIGSGLGSITFPLTDEVKQIVFSDFEDSNDCITCKKLVSFNPYFDNDTDKCWWEYDETHFHPDWQLLNETENEIDYLKAAITSAVVLATRLSKKYPDKGFRIFVSFYETDKNDSDSPYGSSTVRFYQIRENFVGETELRQLDNYKSDAVLEITVESSFT
jgi:hypothetical protein